jgi:hypothetical protein
MLIELLKTISQLLWDDLVHSIDRLLALDLVDSKQVLHNSDDALHVFYKNVIARDNHFLFLFFARGLIFCRTIWNRNRLVVIHLVARKCVWTCDDFSNISEAWLVKAFL